MSQITAKIISDSISATTGTRLTTMELSYHRFIHSEFMTHRVFSRNASSSRAIPVKKLLEQVRNDPMMPIYWGSNKPGMQAGDELIDHALDECKDVWSQGAKDAVRRVEMLGIVGLHKQIANRLLEPFLPIKVVVTSTEWNNFFNLRNHPDAQPEIQELAICMLEAMNNSEQVELHPHEWHLPYITGNEFNHLINDCGNYDYALEQMLKASSARCARVSYLNHDQSSPTLEADLKLFNMLAQRPYDDGKGHVLKVDDPVHLSPLEHQGTPMKVHGWSGNFRNWTQFRQVL